MAGAKAPKQHDLKPLHYTESSIGDMENRIKEQQLDLFADGTSTHWMASNRLRLWLSAFAHPLISTQRACVLVGTELANATIGQIRLRLFKIAARFRVSARRIHIELCSAYPLKTLFAKLHRRLLSRVACGLKRFKLTLGSSNIGRSPTKAEFFCQV
jgi:Transposase DDE domain group 1